mmetsp:Transcript_89788/g.279164  ORF Transcript_89788/g.279164 Transcript_89788/m.279164 type:complete len:440 (-) Transcript_89788:132-1451(-)
MIDQSANGVGDVDLVARVKAVQKFQGGRELWQDFVSKNGGGKKDPAAKPPEFLQAFLSEVDPYNNTVDAVKQGTGLSIRWVFQPADASPDAAHSLAPPGGIPAAVPPVSSITSQSAAMPGMLGPTQVEAVARVKVIQKMPGGHDSWVSFIERHGGGKRDPALRPLSQLHEFLAEADPEGIHAAAAGAAASLSGGVPGVPGTPKTPRLPAAAGALALPGLPGMPGESGLPGGGSRFQPESAEHAHCIARVKALQKMEGGHDLWTTFCEQRGGGKRDPAARPITDLTDFLAEADPEGSTAGVQGTFNESQSLAMQVKKGQRNSEEFKEMWWKYVAEKGNNVRDPTRHTAEFLQAFLEIAPCVLDPENDEVHQTLVQQVKMGQRSSEEFKEAWWQYCRESGSEKHDPARHDRAFLEDFLFNRFGKAVPARPALGQHFRYSPY